jgi:hypothetical protein
MTDTTKAAADAALRTDIHDCIAQTIGACKYASGQHGAIEKFVNGIDIANALTSRVESAIERARAAERNRCAKVCDAIHARHIAEFGDYLGETYASECSSAIRALGTTGEQG